MKSFSMIKSKRAWEPRGYLRENNMYINAHIETEKLFFR